jgi:hypothetical protein
MPLRFLPVYWADLERVNGNKRSHEAVIARDSEAKAAWWNKSILVMLTNPIPFVIEILF